MRQGVLATIALAGALALAGCNDTTRQTSVRPELRPEKRVAARPPSETQPSAASNALTRYYRKVQADLLAQGLLRTDGGGVDTPYDAETLIRNFERLAFYDEYERGRGLMSARNTPGHLRRWTEPVRLTVEFGASVPPKQRRADRMMIEDYAGRLSRITGHPINASSNGNFHVLVLGEDDRPAAMSRIRQLVPNINSTSMGVIRNIPRSIHCLVVAFSDADNDHVYRRAIAIVRAEHPDLLRRSCVHEELAQGLGLANDSPLARPSIFNDDDEFALLTTHDEKLLKMLYDPRLSPGMTPEQARPIFSARARALAGGPS
ncbi:DUF2927 domain-containing protein [Lutimaribacter sp. EGI FJ00015]|uniref:DUF2927 domain-containing protein n=1 Tax=Lutimaribacter degradans TaxID=2945989 RepID=A0ACC5ZWW3_9RHOB|nr:DUF2927 domain-containing protein [Lutimaribacter sp. EGI FJ00013]MCM2562690.1 DUF2927 domain-containing protein [Lutimaribacter sp. EGI FJ00013]MCO0613847.1 DUF2927 domain-containing protein [Lutimaribacter sp. EGI FJ00015]MCO0636670.1 DUF2927 domain-containing protein [Lutimaribacter sp. EGI FJ00014]